LMLVSIISLAEERTVVIGRIPPPIKNEQSFVTKPTTGGSGSSLQSKAPESITKDKTSGTPSGVGTMKEIWGNCKGK